MLSNSGFEQFLPQSLDCNKRAGFIFTHEPRKIHHVGDEYSGETPFLRPEVDANGLGNVFKFMLSTVLEVHVDVFCSMLVGGGAQGNATRLSQPFNSSCDVYAIAVYVIAFDDHVTQIDADAYLQASFCWHPSVAFCRITLGGDCAAHRMDDTRKLHQRPVTHQFDDAAAVLSNLGPKLLLPQFLDSNMGACFVFAHKPRETHHVGDEYSGETPFH